MGIGYDLIITIFALIQSDKRNELQKTELVREHLLSIVLDSVKSGIVRKLLS